VSFAVPPESYDRFMGVYSVQLAPQLAELADVRPGQRVLDVGCGPGALSTELVGRLGADAVSAVDPSESFVAAARERLPGVTVVSVGHRSTLRPFHARSLVVTPGAAGAATVEEAAARG